MSIVTFLTGDENHFNYVSDIPLSKKEEHNAINIIRRHYVNHLIPILGLSVKENSSCINTKTRIKCDEPNCTGVYIIDNHGELVCNVCNVVAEYDAYFNYIEKSEDDEEEHDEDIESIDDLIASPALYEIPKPDIVGLEETQLLTTLKQRGCFISCTHNGITYDSTWELLTHVWAQKQGRHLIYHSPKATFTLPNGRRYEGDFYDEDRNVIIEVKGKEYGLQKQKRDAVMKYFHVTIETWDGPTLIEMGVPIPSFKIKPKSYTRSVQRDLYENKWREARMNYRLRRILAYIKEGVTDTSDLRAVLETSSKATFYSDLKKLIADGRIISSKKGRRNTLALVARK